MNFGKVKSYLKLTSKEWTQSNPLLLGASISFYIVLAAGPILTLIILVMGLYFGEQAATGKIVNEISNVVGKDAAGMIETVIKTASKADNRLLTILTSIPLMLFGSTMVFFQIRNALDSLWRSELKTDTDLSKKLKEYSIAVFMLFVTGAFFFLLMSKTVIIASSDDFFSDIFGSIPFLSRIMNMLITFILVTAFFAMVYKILIKHKLSWKDILTGAVVTSVLFSIVQILISINFNASNIDSAYGAVGSLTILILWIFYSSLIFLFGAAFLKIYSRSNKN
jgi:membrane protein